MVLLTLLTIPRAFECSAKLDQLKSGELYLKVNLSDSSEWLGITNQKFDDILKTYIDKAYLDSQVIALKSRTNTCNDNESKYNEILKTLYDNEILYVNMLNDYREYSMNMSKDVIKIENQKYYFAIYGFIAGTAASILIITVMNMLFIN